MPVAILNLICTKCGNRCGQIDLTMVGYANKSCRACAKPVIMETNGRAENYFN